jgi:hypothetical protein
MEFELICSGFPRAETRLFRSAYCCGELAESKTSNLNGGLGGRRFRSEPRGKKGLATWFILGNKGAN